MRSNSLRPLIRTYPEKEAPPAEAKPEQWRSMAEEMDKHPSSNTVHNPTEGYQEKQGNVSGATKLVGIRSQPPVTTDREGASNPPAHSDDRASAASDVPMDSSTLREETVAATEALREERRAQRIRSRLAAMEISARTPGQGQSDAASISHIGRAREARRLGHGGVPGGHRVGADSGAGDRTSPVAPIAIPPLPKSGVRRHYGVLLSFVVFVLIPLIAISVYYLEYASNQYAAGFKFVVRDAKSASAGVTLGAGAAAGILTATAAPSENYLVADFLTSRDAVEGLQASMDVLSLYSSPDTDWVARFDSSQPIEKFMKYWQRMVTASYDQITGIGTAQVRAFTPEDAYRITSRLLALSEELVNKISNKPRQDAIKFAEGDLQRAEDRLKVVRKALTDFRVSEQVIDPQASIVTGNVQLAQSLRATLNQLETDLKSLRDRQLGPSARIFQDLQSRITATKQQLATVEAEIGENRGGNKTLSRVVGDFEQLELERQFAQTMVQSMMTNLEQARANALAQNVYVTAFITPSMPESPTYPRRILSIFVAAFILVLGWMFVLLIVRSMKEHLT